MAFAREIMELDFRIELVTRLLRETKSERDRVELQSKLAFMKDRLAEVVAERNADAATR